MKHLKLILGDQLNINHSWFKQVDDDVLFVMMEIRPESEYVTHHIQKILGIFSAMRSFSDELRGRGHQVRYYKVSDPDNLHSFIDNLEGLREEYNSSSCTYQEPDEYRLDNLLSQGLADVFDRVEMVSSEHFYTSRYELRNMFEGKKSLLMESFYRSMRRKHHVLMDGDQPITGKWNYDHSNRKKLPKGVTPPNPKIFSKDLSYLYNEIEEAQLNSIGAVESDCFIWPTTRDEALELLEFFVNELLESFGDYQDALTTDYWSLYHCRLSFVLNIKLLSPKEVVDKVESHWREHIDSINISQVEGFIRQILGWREYMRGIYWKEMPGYAELNHFNHESSLPQFYWTGDTKMNCMRHAIEQSLQYGYAHHIQRLMVTGNFALLAGVHPNEVDEWYLGIYLDAFEWVEITNTRGMSQYADGGIVGTKPYVSSGSYINKMSNYCRSCHYNVKEKIGEFACPFNSFYWHFLDRHRDDLAANPRMSMMYRVWDKMTNQEDILGQANLYLDQLEIL